ncbi:ethionine resistance protein [Coemansia umbellata]|uniref:Ethionine resistance protein n=1 Tax=Coemansia umbellata TaxID=1424467 RepID=A0ABQ8PNS2_9FUNG|nr:ethionine resistance protein [Coemansia umbellata]
MLPPQSRDPAQKQTAQRRKSLYIQVGPVLNNASASVACDMPFPLSSSACSSPMLTPTLASAHPRMHNPFESHNPLQSPTIRFQRFATIDVSDAPSSPSKNPAAEARQSTKRQPLQIQVRPSPPVASERRMTASHLLHSLRSAPSSPAPMRASTVGSPWSFDPTSNSFAQPCCSPSRRQSIARQSSCSSHLPLALPQRPPSNMPGSPLHQYPQQQQRLSQPPSANVASPQSLASARSLCFPRLNEADAASAATICTLQVGIQPQDRRRSIAYERYPPLVSIFESCDPGSAGAYPESSAAGTSSLVSTPFLAPSPWLPAADEAAEPDDWLHAEANSCYHSSPTNDFGGQDEEPSSPFLKHNTSSSSSSTTSLASVFSIASTSSSVSSTPSSYAYIFDSARTPTTPAQKNSRHGYTTLLPGGIGKRQFVKNFLLAIADRPSFDVMSAMTTSAVLADPARRENVAELGHNYTDIGSSERTPLIGTLVDEHTRPMGLLIARESKSIFSAASHLFIGNALQAVISMSQIASSGHLGGSELAAIGLAHMVVVLTGYPLAFSVLSCLETCASQAFTSAQPRLVGAYFVQAVQTLWGFGLVLGSLWFSSEPLLTYIMHGASPATISNAVSYLRWYFVPFMVFATMLCARQVLYAQGITYPLPYLTLLGALVTISAQYMLVFSPHVQLGVRGIALGNGIGYTAMLVATLLVIRCHNPARIWGRVRAPWRPFIRLLPSCILLSLLSTGSSELITMAATQLGTNSLSAQSVLSAMCRMFMIAVSSVGVAALNRSGNLIGRQDARGAKVSSHMALLIGSLCAAAGCSAMLRWPGIWIRIFTNNLQIIEDVQDIMPVAVLAFAAQSLAFVGSQLLSAQGRQALAARIKFIALYAIGVPLGYYWAIDQSYGLWGLWVAVAIGQLCSAVVELLVVLNTNWHRLVRLCAESIVHGDVY